MHVNMARFARARAAALHAAGQPPGHPEQPAPDHRGRLRHDRQEHGSSASAPSGRTTRPSARSATKGSNNRKGSTRPCHKIVRVTPTGETWVVYLDPETRLPALVAGDGRERRPARTLSCSGTRPSTSPSLPRPSAFDPDARWGPAKGLLAPARARRGRHRPGDRSALTGCLPKWRLPRRTSAGAGPLDREKPINPNFRVLLHLSEERS